MTNAAKTMHTGMNLEINLNAAREIIMMNREYNFSEVTLQLQLLQQNMKAHNLPYVCKVDMVADNYLLITLLRKGEKVASFKRQFNYRMATVWFDGVSSQLWRIHLLLAAEEEYLQLSVKQIKRLYTKGIVDKSVYVTACGLANKIFPVDDYPQNHKNSNNVIDLNGIKITREAADTVERLIDWNSANDTNLPL